MAESAHTGPSRTGDVPENPNSREDPLSSFYIVTDPSPHVTRRKMILEKHPEVRFLYGHDTTQVWAILCIVVTQLLLSYIMGVVIRSWPLLLFVAWLVGGFMNNGVTLIIHELSHSLVTGNAKYERLLGMFVSLPMSVPVFFTFRKYHLEHHQFMGVPGLDTDLPSSLETFFIKSNSPITKLIGVLLNPFLYSLRPMFINPKLPTGWEIANWVVQLAFDWAVYQFFGFKSLMYLFGSASLGLGLHPLAAHFIAEHFVTTPLQETYSYYGPLNWLGFNVGYHNEHHDFMNIPGSRLPVLRKMAPEFYDTLPHYDSWVAIFWWYITNSKAGPFARVTRNHPQQAPPELPDSAKCE